MAPAATVAVWIWLAVPVALIVVGTIVLIAVFGRRPRDSYDRSQPRHVYQNDARAMAMPDARIAPDRAAPVIPSQVADSGAIGRHAPARDTKFTYSTGDRPLDGYTIKRGVGRGGFGEVYYATSDGGKEVALKLVQRHLDVELRGVSQCLNLKHPHLVTLYDVRQSQNGDHWIVMEYVGGECLGRRSFGRTALSVAAERGHATVVRMLLERGADPDARRHDGETALSLAVTAGHATVVEVLLAAAADVNPRASDGDTPLIEAAYAGHVAILCMLLDHGADMTCRSGIDGSTALIWASYEGHTACVQALAEHGANVNEKDTGDGSTPLIWAAWGNHPNVVRVLLDHGADPSETNSSGETAADHAESETVKAMLEAAMARR